MNKYEYIKEQLDARDVVTDILGKPDKTSGENYYWHSPWRERR